jgi:hypothetical protein
MDIMKDALLQEAQEGGIMTPMKAKKEIRKRYRLPLEFPEEEKPLWHRARIAALTKKMTIGQFVADALRAHVETCDREAHKR